MNKKLRCFLVDDETHARTSLEYLLEFYCGDDIEVVGFSSDFSGAVDALSLNKPDVLFLDIKLGYKTGFDLIKEIDNLDSTHIIIVTAYNEYASEAYRHNAIDYLLKPINPIELNETIKRLKKLSAPKNIKEFSQNHQEKFFFPIRDGWDSILFKDIVCLRADNSYTDLHCSDESVKCISKGLNFFEQALTAQADFIRVHRSYIVNKTHIKKILRQNNGLLIMSNGVEIPISTNAKEKLLTGLGLLNVY